MNVNKTKQYQSGVGMLETLIAALMVSFGLIAYMQLVQTNMKNTDSAYFRNQSTILIADMFDRMRANGDDAIDGDYNIAYATAVALPPVTQADTELELWRSTIIETLPQGESAVACVKATRVCTVSIRWDDSRGTEGSNQQEVVIASLVRGG